MWFICDGSFIERNYFAFYLLDHNRDGYIGASDLLEIYKEILICNKAQNQYDCECLFSNEINKLYKFCYTWLLTKSEFKQKEEISIENFIKLTKLSCLVTEFRNMFLFDVSS